MTFDYQRGVTQDQEKWKEFNTFLYELSLSYPEEFKKEIYRNQRFMMLYINAKPTDISVGFHNSVPDEIQKSIQRKLKELFH